MKYQFTHDVIVDYVAHKAGDIVDQSEVANGYLENLIRCRQVVAVPEKQPNPVKRQK